MALSARFAISEPPSRSAAATLPTASRIAPAAGEMALTSCLESARGGLKIVSGFISHLQSFYLRG